MNCDYAGGRFFYAKAERDGGFIFIAAGFGHSRPDVVGAERAAVFRRARRYARDARDAAFSENESG